LDQTWLDRVETELRRRRLPQPEVVRLISELSDHLSDVVDSQEIVSRNPPLLTLHASSSSLLSLKDDLMRMEASAVDCLGSPAEIADTALREFRRRRNLLSRSRLAAFGTFVLLPLPVWFFSWVVTLVLSCKALEWIGLVPAGTIGPVDVTLAQIVLTQGTMIVASLAPSAGLVALFARFAARTQRPLLWGLTACALIAFVTAFEGYGADLNQPQGQRFWFGPSVRAEFAMRQTLQCAVPLMVGFLALKRFAHLPARTTG
jgi:hypothetical protein